MSSKALGLIETIGLTSAIEAADAASKAANVTLLGYENSKGGGMITVKVVGDVGAVKAAVAAGSAAALRVGKVASCHIIPRPAAAIEPLINSVTRGKQTPAEKPKPAAKPKPKPAAKKTAAKSPAKKIEPEAPQPQPSSDVPLAGEDTPPAE
jgi:microcompartment protein CcmL/EutN